MSNYIPAKKDVLFSILNSYSQVFFSTSKTLALVLLVISFFDYGAGLGGLAGVLIANLLAWVLGFNKALIRSGIYGFNALLAGLGAGMFYQPSWQFLLLVAIASVICFLLAIAFQGILGKYGLPFLSIPFLITVWIIALSGSSLTALNISERGIFVFNELYSIGGQKFVDFYNFLESNIRLSFLRIYFHSLGAIFFQTHLLAGILISVGLLFYSRITFVMSFLGFSVAYLFYQIAGIEFNSLEYTYIGFNYILTAIALGGYFLIPGRTSFFWVIIILPAVVLFTISSQQLFEHIKISPYSLPFNIVVLLFLYTLKFRSKRSGQLIETPVQLGKPEKNIYYYSGSSKRFPAAYPVSVSLPFFGEWTVNQAHNGEHTHRGNWKHAWDFVITNRAGQQYKAEGNFCEDYFCFGKAVLAPYYGTVVEVENTVHDNKIGDVNTKNNWGNTVIIKHTETLYSKLCHLKYKSVEVKVGDVVQQGQVIGLCGNSGRSPYPHLHFQFQQTPFIGSVTLEYPFGHFLLKDKKSFSLQTFGIPREGDVVANPLKNDVLAKALHFIPGQRIKANVVVDSEIKKWKKLEGSFLWNVETDVYNATSIKCDSSGTRAYLYNNGDIFYFTNYLGKKYTPLFWLYLALYKIPIGYLPKSKITDSVQLNILFGGVLKVLQDFVAPLFLFLKVGYELKFTDSDDILASGNVNFKTIITKNILGRNLKTYKIKGEINHQAAFQLTIDFNEAKITVTCRNELE